MSTSKREQRTPEHDDEPNVPVAVPSSVATGEATGDEQGAIPAGVTDVPMPVELTEEHGFPDGVTDVPVPTVDELVAPPHSLP